MYRICSSNLPRNEEIRTRAVYLVISTHMEGLFPIIFAYHTEITPTGQIYNGNLPLEIRLRNYVGNSNTDPLQ